MELTQAQMQQLLAQHNLFGPTGGPTGANGPLGHYHQNQRAGMNHMPWSVVGVVGSIGALQGAISGPVTPAEPLTAAGMKVEDLIGWRIWRLKNGHLWSYSVNYAWMPGEVSEGAPGDYDGAGIWAFKDKRRAFQKAVESGSDYVWGSVLLWGHVVEHADGYRASKARIVSLDGTTRDITRGAFVDLCEIHGVPAPARIPKVRSLERLVPWSPFR